MAEARIIPSATILLVRDRGALEVLMVERRYEIDFAAGALVFPGGKLAQEDEAPDWAGHVDETDPTRRAYLIGAVREAFEESGLLLARPKAQRGAGAPLADDATIAPLKPMRDAIAKSEQSFLAAIADHGLVLALDQLCAYAHWITPMGMPKRFDTHFFIAHTPPNQTALGDGGEVTEAVWVEPAEALTAAKEGRRKIIFPTRLNLELLVGPATADAAIAEARARRIVTVEPKIVRRDGAMVLTIPAEAGYSVTEEALEPNMP